MFVVLVGACQSDGRSLHDGRAYRFWWLLLRGWGLLSLGVGLQVSFLVHAGRYRKTGQVQHRRAAAEGRTSNGRSRQKSMGKGRRYGVGWVKRRRW